MTTLVRAPLGVCVFPEPGPNSLRTTRYSRYVYEILDHAGFAYSTLEASELVDRLPELSVLLTVGDFQLTPELACGLESWGAGGGEWISVGGVSGKEDMFGVEVEPPSWSLRGLKMGTLGEGYLNPVEPDSKLLEHLAIPLHFFNGIPVRASGAKVLASVLDAHGRPTERAALTINRFGDGSCTLIAPDITGAVVRIQQGVSVSRDGVPAPDGTAPIDDQVGKTDDGCVLDWILDRQPVDGVEGFSAFLQPIADQWREILVRAILDACARRGVSLPVLWLYPRNLPALGHISHDTDNCEVPNAWSMLEVVASAGINTTWCTILPGYPQEVIDAIRNAGHELGFHYDAMSEGCHWGKAEFDETIRRLREMLGEPAPVTNKNHYLRWRGDTEFFDWCVENGIELDESKGPSKSGNVGFTFGTCHPYFPIDRDGRSIDVLELPTLTQDLLIVAPKELSQHLADGAAKHHGIMHILHHPSHIQKPGIADALLGAIEQGKRHGMEFWTARRINEWERARRSARWSGWRKTSSGTQCVLRADRVMDEATLMCLSTTQSSININGSGATGNVERWGFTFASAIVDIEPGRDYTVETLNGEGTK